ncbi:hypothetical protein PHLGIDRAFT_128118 [Phlebiopsis gigantea 11061_1 CR5-6]|uniref:Arrestin-like N-terminal domain-containing protein n=1 Tax=Phlebiopsis gigantea (strain 11061_1 CR5-6) TaxID=745531 RepID=A0A0C3RXN1_PHLG1|nr:hypothetical protein PHLGIDRAFT_128118 [Phlebiopsis gigantea 11061_1 CR5-6]
MTSTRHPFAYTQYMRYSQSTDAFATWLRATPEPAIPPVPPRPLPPKAPAPLARSFSQPPVMYRERRESTRARLLPPSPPVVDFDTPTVSSRSEPGHYVKHSSWVTLLLSGQEEGVSEPVYCNGATIEGILAVPRPAGLLRLEVKVEGQIRLKELAGSGAFESEIINDTVFAWDAECNATFPAKVTFRYTLPTRYTHAPTDEEFRLPPSYQAHLSGVPGFRVGISYAVVVHITLNRSKMNWWRKGTRLRVPFVYRELSRPSLAGPFSARPMKTLTSPRTVFKYLVESRRGSHENIELELYIPNSQVCSMRDPIPYVVTIFAREEILSKYTTFRSSLESFHPMDSPSPDVPNSEQPQFFGCLMSHSSPVRLQVLRKTHVDVLAASVGASVATGERTDITASKCIASGVVYGASREYSSVVWSGTIVVPEKVRCGGFGAKGIVVSDSLMLTLVHPSALRASYVDFSAMIPIRLTTETYECSSGVVTVSDMSG